MTDLPLTTGQPDRGAGGYQFTGLTLYDPLVAWELDVADRPGRMVPGLATAWEADRPIPRSGPSTCGRAWPSTTARPSMPTR